MTKEIPLSLQVFHSRNEYQAQRLNRTEELRLKGLQDVLKREERLYVKDHLLDRQKFQYHYARQRSEPNTNNYATSSNYCSLNTSRQKNRSGSVSSRLSVFSAPAKLQTNRINSVDSSLTSRMCSSFGEITTMTRFHRVQRKFSLASFTENGLLTSRGTKMSKDIDKARDILFNLKRNDPKRSRKDSSRLDSVATYDSKCENEAVDDNSDGCNDNNNNSIVIGEENSGQRSEDAHIMHSDGTSPMRCSSNEGSVSDGGGPVNAIHNHNNNNNNNNNNNDNNNNNNNNINNNNNNDIIENNEAECSTPRKLNININLDAILEESPHTNSKDDVNYDNVFPLPPAGGGVGDGGRNIPKTPNHCEDDDGKTLNYKSNHNNLVKKRVTIRSDWKGSNNLTETGSQDSGGYQNQSVSVLDGGTTKAFSEWRSRYSRPTKRLDPLQQKINVFLAVQSDFNRVFPKHFEGVPRTSDFQKEFAAIGEEKKEQERLERKKKNDIVLEVLGKLGIEDENIVSIYRDC